MFLSFFAFGCGDGTSGEGNTDGNFVPAVPPENACSFLTVADISTILPNPGAGSLSDADVTNEDAWSRGCYWQTVGAMWSASLTIDGASTIVAWGIGRPPATNQGGLREELSGLGEEAAYFENDFGETGVAAASGSYAVQLDSESESEPPPRKEALVALVRKVLAKLGE